MSNRSEHKVVDVFSGLGKHVEEFLQKGASHKDVLDDSIKELKPQDCLCVERADYRYDLEGQGYDFMDLDQHQGLSWMSHLPQADYYVCWNQLTRGLTAWEIEHLIGTMIHQARKLVWLRLPCFESDEASSAAALHKHGLCFYWERNRDYTPFTLLDFMQAFGRYQKGSNRPDLNVKISADRYVRSTESPLVVPLTAPETTVGYTSLLDSKPLVQFGAAMVSHWDIIIRSENMPELKEN